LSYLDLLGYNAVVVEGTNNVISLVQMGVAAGVGEQSPVNSLVVSGLGLTANIGAIITNAKLIPDAPVSGVCIHCDECLTICPIRDEAYAKGDLTWCGCGACFNICPV
jgi:epoxyqueuosine reductase QueG